MKFGFLPKQYNLYIEVYPSFKTRKIEDLTDYSDAFNFILETFTNVYRSFPEEHMTMGQWYLQKALGVRVLRYGFRYDDSVDYPVLHIDAIIEMEKMNEKSAEKMIEQLPKYTREHGDYLEPDGFTNFYKLYRYRLYQNFGKRRRQGKILCDPRADGNTFEDCEAFLGTTGPGRDENVYMVFDNLQVFPAQIIRLEVPFGGSFLDEHGQVQLLARSPALDEIINERLTQRAEDFMNAWQLGAWVTGYTVTVNDNMAGLTIDRYFNSMDTEQHIIDSWKNTFLEKSYITNGPNGDAPGIVLLQNGRTISIGPENVVRLGYSNLSANE